MTITKTMTVAEVAAAIPSSVRIFERYGIDFCCRGRRALATACADRGVSFAELARAIETAGEERSGDQRDWAAAPLHELIDHIVTTYHDLHRDQLPRLQAWAERALVAHGAWHSDIFETLQRNTRELASELPDHMANEERILFPAIGSRERGDWSPTIPLAAVIGAMEQEHDHAGALLVEMRRTTGGYEPPPWACATVTALYRGLAELEASLHVHVHLENNVLFPRALALPQPTLSA
jgi:regulator of cell morphogenesis and NO signaling